MSAVIATFPKEVKGKFAPHEPLVKMLESMLENAKTGHLQAVAVACVYHDNLDAGGAAGEGWNMAPGTKYALSHAIMRLRITYEDAIRRDEI